MVLAILVIIADKNVIESKLDLNSFSNWGIGQRSFIWVLLLLLQECVVYLPLFYFAYDFYEIVFNFSLSSSFLHISCESQSIIVSFERTPHWYFNNFTPVRLRHMKNKSLRQSHASSLNSEAIDVWKVARHQPSRRVVACDDYYF